ncbi:hypothetical protein EMIT0111MI5_20085 [Burkholderia sp. IT-111MI5]
MRAIRRGPMRIAKPGFVRCGPCCTRCERETNDVTEELAVATAQAVRAPHDGRRDGFRQGDASHESSMHRPY